MRPAVAEGSRFGWLRSSHFTLVSVLSHLLLLWLFLALLPRREVVVVAESRPIVITLAAPGEGADRDPALEEQGKERKRNRTEQDEKKKEIKEARQPERSRKRADRERRNLLGAGGEGNRRGDEEQRKGIDRTLAALGKLADASKGGSSSPYGLRSASGRGQGTAEHGGTRASEKAVELALDWLARHQDTSGRWQGSRFDGLCRRGKCSGTGFRYYDTGLTGLSLLAFLGAGYHHMEGRYRLIVRRGLRALLARQHAKGFFATENLYNHALAVLAVAEAHGMTRDRALFDPLRRGVAALVVSQQRDGGWTYTPFPNEPRNDASVTGFCIQALKAASEAGVQVPRRVFGAAIRHLRKMTNERGRLLYEDRGSHPFRRTRALDWVGLLCRLLLGERRDSADLARIAGALERHPPDWEALRVVKGNDPRADYQTSFDDNMYAWYYGTLASFSLGGRPWRVWNTRLRDVTVARQIVGGCAQGSWDPVGKWGRAGGRVYATALMALNLEIYYRYAPGYLQRDRMGLRGYWLKNTFDLPTGGPANQNRRQDRIRFSGGK